jgi:hypothetical protein
VIGLIYKPGLIEAARLREIYGGNNWGLCVGMKVRVQDDDSLMAVSCCCLLKQKYQIPDV